MQLTTRRGAKKMRRVPKKRATLGARIIEGLEEAIAWTRGENDDVRMTLPHVPDVMPTRKFGAEILVAAVEGFEAQKRRIDERIAEVRQMLDGVRPEPVATAEIPKAKRRKISTAGRKTISAATKNRWAAALAVKPAERPAVAKKVAAPKPAVKKAAVKSAVNGAAKKTAVKKAQTKAANTPTVSTQSKI
jgi:hypothetical protein